MAISNEARQEILAAINACERAAKGDRRTAGHYLAAADYLRAALDFTPGPRFVDDYYPMLVGSTWVVAGRGTFLEADDDGLRFGDQLSALAYAESLNRLVEMHEAAGRG